MITQELINDIWEDIRSKKQEVWWQDTQRTGDAIRLSDLEEILDKWLNVEKWQ